MADRRAARLQGRSKRLPARRGRCPSRKDYDAAGALIGTAAREGIEAALAGRAYTRDEKALAAARATVARYEATHGVPERGRLERDAGGQRPSVGRLAPRHSTARRAAGRGGLRHHHEGRCRHANHVSQA
jgi:hypothetical protein